jgi:molybdopterin synthase sulfur carrier subunit
MIYIKFFASVRERVGVAEIEWECPPEVCTISHLIDLLDTHFGLDIRSQHLLAARNQVHVPFSESLTDGDELALFPPVTGG